MITAKERIEKARQQKERLEKMRDTFLVIAENDNVSETVNIHRIIQYHFKPF